MDKLKILFIGLLLSFASIPTLYAQTIKNSCDDLNRVVDALLNDPDDLLGSKEVKTAYFFGVATEVESFGPGVYFQGFNGYANQNQYGTTVTYEILKNEAMNTEKANEVANQLTQLLGNCLDDSWYMIYSGEDSRETYFVQKQDMYKAIGKDKMSAPYVYFTLYSIDGYSLDLSFINPQAK